ncbi:hypothetical protein AY599_27015 [Leptolyngbya valderiana BDU 20041]|nr:hypothetical protein AY599_27015 [Leptolyngbya valderiana BDU 20041]
MDIVEDLLTAHPAVRYVAVKQGDDLRMRQKDSDLAGASSSESDTYEEWLTNPVLLQAAGNRGQLGCGGLSYVLVRYGNFWQFVRAVPGGHVSVCIDQASDPVALLPTLFERLVEHFGEGQRTY